MLGSVCEVVMLPVNGLDDVIKAVNEEYCITEGDPDWFDPDDSMYMFWCDQEFGTSCHMKIDVSDKAIQEYKDWLLKYEHHEMTTEADIYLAKAQIRVLEYLRAHIPMEVDTVMVPIDY